MAKKQLSQSQTAFCNAPRRALRLLAPAGSGKTLTILWRCHRLVQDDPNIRILLFTFTRVARDELVNRLKRPEFVSIQPNVVVTTLNSYGFQRVRHDTSNVKLVTTKQSRRDTMLNVLKPIWMRFPELNAVLSQDHRKFKAVETLFSLSDRLKSLGFVHDRDDHFDKFARHIDRLQSIGLGLMLGSIFKDLAELGLLTDAELIQLQVRDASRKALTTDEMRLVLPIERKIYDNYFEFWRASTEMLLNCAMLTLEDQKYQAFRIYSREVCHNAEAQTQSIFQHVIVDEFQDINPLDLALLKVIAKLNRTQVTIVGDDDQAIFEWRGASPAFILDPKRFFGIDYQTHILETNYRSPSNIVEMSQRLIAHNHNRVQKCICAAKNTDAHVEIVPCASVADAVKNTINLVKGLGRECRKIALISRKRSQIIPYQILFAGNDIPFFAAEDLQIFLSQAFVDLKEMIGIRAQVNERKGMNFDPRAALLKLCDKIKRYPLSRSDRESLSQYLLTRQPDTLLHACMALREYHGPLKGDNDGAKMSELFFQRIRSFLKSATVSEAIEVLESFEGLQQDYGKADEDIFYSDPPFFYLTEFAQVYGCQFERFYQDIEKTITTLANDVANVDVTLEGMNRKIHLLTALRAKGKEYDAVFILDANQDIWPSKLAKTPEELEQERRLFYVAVTRAQQFLYFIVDGKFKNKAASPTQYLAEMSII